MKHALILLSIGLLLNVFHKFDAELNVVPRDTEVMVNDSTYMNCSTSLEAEKVQWRHGNNYVYAGQNILEPYNVRFTVEINSSTGTSNLVIRSVQPSDAGQYECVDDEGSGERRSAQVIVLFGDPVCKSSMQSSGVIGPNTCGIEAEDVKFSCSITYYGNIFPILQWKASGDNQSIIEGLINFTSNKNDVAYTFTMKSTLDLNNSSFICQTTKSSNRNYSCSSDIIKLLYVFSSNVTVNMTTNDEVSCFANTSQSCSYKWKWFNGDDSVTVSDGHILKPNTVGWHRCEATCSIGNKSCTVESMYAEVYSTVATTREKELPLMVLIALPVIVSIGVVIYCWRKKKIRKNMLLRIDERELKALRRKFKRQSPNESGKPVLNKVEELELQEREREQEQQSLIDTLPKKYKLDPVLVQVMRAGGKGIWVSGLTILDKELFVAPVIGSEVEVYDSMKFTFNRRLTLKELINPQDIKSCNRNKCLYILDFEREANRTGILRVDPRGELIKKWSTGTRLGFGLSVTGESNVIFASCLEHKLTEYSPDGQLIREINLTSKASIRSPTYAIKLTSGHFLVRHYFFSNDLPGVCVVDADGTLQKSYREECGSDMKQMNDRISLAVDGNGFVMVADGENGRVVLLNLDLEFKREILSNKKHGLKKPKKILLDETNGRLFVVDNDCVFERILIFKFIIK